MSPYLAPRTRPMDWGHDRILNARTLSEAKGPLSKKSQCQNPLKSRLEPWIGETDLNLVSCPLAGRLAHKAFSFLESRCRGGAPTPPGCGPCPVTLSALPASCCQRPHNKVPVARQKASPTSPGDRIHRSGRSGRGSATGGPHHRLQVLVRADPASRTLSPTRPTLNPSRHGGTNYPKSKYQGGRR